MEIKKYLLEILSGPVGILFTIITGSVGFFLLLLAGANKSRDNLLWGICLLVVAAVLFSIRLLVVSGIVEIGR